MQYRITIHYAELALKGKNRQQFVKRLRQNIRRKLMSMGLDWEVTAIHDRIFVKAPDTTEQQAEQVVAEIARIPGIAWLSFAHWFEERIHRFMRPKPDLQPLHDLVKKLAEKTHRPGLTFAMRVKRSDKNFSKTSQQLAAELATTVLQETPWSDVNLTQPDQIFYVNVSSKGTAVYTNKIKGTGGLPVSTTGRVLTLLSGGFDSPVAAWLMSNRGCNVDFVHFSASHYKQQDVTEYKISRIAQIISETAGKVRLFVVPYTHFDMALMAQDLAYDLILFRRFMARVAQRIMTKLEAQALVTGDNLGQVASQTMENIDSMNQSVTVPILRPLLTYNKEQIIELSHQLGLFDVCREPYKDCCALISKNPKTRSDARELQRLETTHLADYETLIEDTLSEVTTVTYHFGQLVEVNAGTLP